MDDETIVNDDTSNITDTTANDSLTAEEKYAVVEQQNKKLYARAKTAEGFVQDSTGRWVKKEKPQAIISEKQESKPYNILEDEVFDFINEGYSKEEIRFIQSNGGRKALENKDSLVSIAVKTKREQRIAEDASGKLSDKAGLSEVERKYTTEQMRAMKPEDLANLIGFAQ